MSEFAKLKRPKRGETEEDLLKEMKQFESSKASVLPENIVNFSKKKDESAKKTSKFASERQQQKRQHDDDDVTSKSSIAFILKSVVQEKDFSNSGSFDFEQKPEPEQPFPVAEKLLLSDNKNAEPPNSGKKKSLFAQQMLSGSKFKEERRSNISSQSHLSERFHRDFGAESLLLKSCSVLPPDERWSIHEGNVNILNAKTEEQLKEDRDNLLKQLDPSIVEFLRKRRTRTSVPEDSKTELPPKVETQVEEEPMIVETEPIQSRVKEESMIVDEVEPKKPVIPVKIGDVELEDLRKFTHMETVEAEKMEWMVDIEKKETGDNPPSQFNARFDFAGCLLPYDSDEISVKAGLHHHGDEPERPGYTLEELLTLARSSMPQQRTIALSTLARIIDNFKKGRFDNCFGPETNLLTQLIQADLVTLLRTGLDENNSAVIIEATVNCLAELVDNQIEEIGLDTQFFSSLFPGYVQPSLQVKISADAEFQKEAPELKDIQIVNADLVLGLLRMDILDRLAYVLDILKPSSQTTVVNILRLLARLSRHSLASASKVVQHKTILSIVVRHFLPMSSALSSTTGNVYGTPVHHALKLLRVLMSWSRNITSEILDRFDLGKKILCYIALEPNQENAALPLQEALRLTIEACRVWIVCLRFGLETERFLEFYPIIMNHVKFLNTNVSMVSVLPGTKFNYHHATALLEVISAAICCVPNSLEVYSSIERRAIRGQPLDWSHLTGIVDLLEYCLKKWIHESAGSNMEDLQPFCVGLLASCISLFGTYIERYPASDTFEAVSFLQKLEDLYPFVLNYLLKSDLVSKLIRSTLKHSVLGRHDLVEGRRRDPENLPSLGSITYSGDVLAGLQETSPFAFLNSLMFFIRAALKSHTSLDTTSVVAFMKSESLVAYLVKIVKVGYKKSSSNWFARQEIHFLRIVIEINHQLKALDLKLVWKLAGILLAHYQVGDEFYIRQILREIIFNPDYLDPTDSVIWKLRNTELNQSNVRMMTMEEAMPKILKLYTRMILPDINAVEKSIKMNVKLCYSVSSLTINSNGETCLPADWQYLPLLTVLNRRMLPPSSGGVNDMAKSEDHEIDDVQLCLIWVYIMTISSKIEHHMSSASACLRLTRLATVFLATPDLFLDPIIHKITEMCLLDIMTGFGSLKFDDSIPGIDSFSDFYFQLVDQFQAVSYGDPLFALFIMLPLTNVNVWKYRSTLWNDHPEALRSIALSAKDLPMSLNVASFVEKTGETKKDILRAYVKALITDDVTAKRNPLLYDIAVANATKACKEDQEFRQEITAQLSALKKTELLEKIVPNLLS